MLKLFVFLSAMLLVLSACDKSTLEPTSDANLVFKLQLNPNQDRLDGLAQPSTIPSGNAGQTPVFNGFSAHKIELVPSAITLVNEGAIVYHGAETNAGGQKAVDFSKAVVVNNGETIVSVPIKDIAVGNYPYIRVSVSYQNYDIKFNIKNIPLGGGQTTDLNQQTGTIASFLGFNNYVETVQPRTLTQTVNTNKSQGYWAFESNLNAPYSSFNAIYTGDATGTTVVNPLSSTAPIPAGSCLVTGVFDGSGLDIQGDETEDIVVNLSFSINQSLEWVDLNSNGELDIDMSNNSVERIVDMGLRGLKPSVQ
ncbi:MAG: hypothetical protein AB8E82_02230 [Aureispira sp.]